MQLCASVCLTDCPVLRVPQRSSCRGSRCRQDTAFALCVPCVCVCALCVCALCVPLPCVFHCIRDQDSAFPCGPQVIVPLLSKDLGVSAGQRAALLSSFFKGYILTQLVTPQAIICQ